MARFDVRTGGGDPQGKPRVWFSCHPEDMERELPKACEYLFGALDCAVYYTPHMDAPFEGGDLDTDLGRFNLLVIPVTLKLLTGSCRTMDFDKPYALGHNIPVLPIMTVPGLDALYSLERNFGNLHYLDASGADDREFRGRLRRYLDGVLINGETAERIRGSFSAHAFLSYRKSDRTLAGELMRLIHSEDAYRDVAIWYDEFLTPGEDFTRLIDDAIKRSDLFTLLVTSKLVDGLRQDTDNYVHSVEYPEAVALGKNIFPVEMSPTDHEELRRYYDGIPEPVDPASGEAFRQRLHALLGDVSGGGADSGDPEHLYLIGLAYLSGTDMEVDIKRGTELITRSAESGYLEAMKRLRMMYHSGSGVARDPGAALMWSRRVAELTEKSLGEEDRETLKALEIMAEDLDECGQVWECLQVTGRIFELEARCLGVRDPDTVITLHQLAGRYFKAGINDRALRHIEEAANLASEVFGPGDIRTLRVRADHSLILHACGMGGRALECAGELYGRVRDVCGENDPFTVTVTENYAVLTGMVQGDFEKERELLEEVCRLSAAVYGPGHPKTLNSRMNLAGVCSNLSLHDLAVSEARDACAALGRVCGREHPDAMEAMYTLGSVLLNAGNAEEAVDALSQAYSAQLKVLGGSHPQTLRSLEGLAGALSGAGRLREAVDAREQAYKIRCGAYGSASETLLAAADLANAYMELGDAARAMEMCGEITASMGEEVRKGDDSFRLAMFTASNVCLRAGNFIKHTEFLKLMMSSGDTDSPDDPVSRLRELAALSRNSGDAVSEAEYLERIGWYVLSRRGPYDGDTSEAMRVAAKAWERAGDFLRYSQCLFIFRIGSFGSSPELMGRIISDLSGAYISAYPTKALALEQKYSFLRRALGDNSDITLDAMNELLADAVSSGDMERAAALSDTWGAIVLKNRGAEKSEYLRGILGAAVNRLWASGKQEQSLTYRERLFEQMYAASGPGNQETAGCFIGLLDTSLKLADPSAALRVLETLFDFIAQRLEEDGFMPVLYTLTYQYMAYQYERGGVPETAYKILLRVLDFYPLDTPNPTFEADALLHMAHVCELLGRQDESRAYAARARALQEPEV